MKTLFVAVAAFVAAVHLEPSSARADHPIESLGCKAGVCLSAGFMREVLHLRVQTQHGRATHFNIRNGCAGGQVEVGPSGVYSHRMPIGSPARCSVSVQSCVRGARLGPISGRSACSDWAEFSVAASNTVVGGHRECKSGFCAEILNHTGSSHITITLRSFPRSTHRNIRGANGQQVQADNATFPGNSVSVQACNKPTFGSSKCTPWVAFR